jgi:hypothetical protein
MAMGLDGLLFTLTTTLIVARILAFPMQIDLHVFIMTAWGAESLAGGGGGWVMVFCFVRIFFFSRAKREIFFQNLTLGYM